jgi:3-hydroxyisobutyrate dehydrogenase-like beta-hydroxyacid dehydrogenase
MQSEGSQGNNGSEGSRDGKPTIGFIGLGRMGTPMASRLLDAGYDVVGYDTVEPALRSLVDRGATAASGPRDVANRSDIVLTSLPVPAVVEKVVVGDDGVLGGSRARIFVDLSTTGPRMAARIGELLAEDGRITMVDCPVSGGVAGAEKGTLTMMMSGAEAACREVKPILAHLGRVLPCGDKPGHGQMVKLANNLMSVTAIAIGCEAFVLGARAGVDPKAMLDVINASSGRSGATQDKFPKHILPRTFDFGFSTALSHKDTRLCLDEAEALGVPMMIGSAVAQVLTMTKTAFGPEADFTNMLRTFEQLAGVEVQRVDRT